jgi:hypothetical protein
MEKKWDNPLSKLQIRHWLHRLKLVKTWQLIIVLLLVTLVAATLLRMNNLGMVERRTAVIQADEKGDKGLIRSTLTELQRYVSGHMNTDMNGGVYLSHSYERDRAAALEAASNSSNPNSGVYQQASVECRSRFQGGTASFRNDYVQCVIEKVSSLSSAQDAAASLVLPRAGNYHYDFAAPVWSLDLAGLAVAVAALIIGVILSRLVALGILNLLLRRRYNSA